jgi:hypothetical protein
MDEREKREEEDAEGHSRFFHVSPEGTEEDAEGQGVRLPPKRDDREGEEQNTEGHGRRTLSPEGDEDDAEGHSSSIRKR